MNLIPKHPIYDIFDLVVMYFIQMLASPGNYRPYYFEHFLVFFIVDAHKRRIHISFRENWSVEIVIFEICYIVFAVDQGNNIFGCDILFQLEDSIMEFLV